MAHELFPFKFFDTVRRRWVTARYRATREVIASTYAKWEITGAPEIRAAGTGCAFAVWVRIWVAKLPIPEQLTESAT